MGIECFRFSRKASRARRPRREMNRAAMSTAIVDVGWVDSGMPVRARARRVFRQIGHDERVHKGRASPRGSILR
jgi:hypothetical protein